MSIRPAAQPEPRPGCCSRGAEFLCEKLIAAVKRVRTRRAHRRLAEEAAGEGLTSKRNTVTRTDGKVIGTVQLIAGELAEISALQAVRPTPRERLFGKRLVVLKREGVYIGTIDIDIRRNTGRARPPIDAHSITSGGAAAPYDSEVERAVLYALKYARY